MKTYYSFDDVLLLPQFSAINSRKDVDVSTKILGLDLKFGVISSNMDTVTELNMANAMSDYGAIGCLHRFMPIEQNAWMYEQASKKGNVLVSVGVGTTELDRFKALYDAGARQFVLDVANGASMQVVKQVHKMRDLEGNNFQLMVGNFATGRSVEDFLFHCGDDEVQALKLGVGGGSACTTRLVSGCGLPTLASILDIKNVTLLPLVADGGIRTSGDLAKAFVAGASAVMLGGLLAGSYESPGEIVVKTEYNADGFSKYKNYRGSASAESYEVQGKTALHRAPEGESFLVSYSGPVANTLQKLEAGLRGAMTTVGAMTLPEFREKGEFAVITQNGVMESKAHGKKL